MRSHIKYFRQRKHLLTIIKLKISTIFKMCMKVATSKPNDYTLNQFENDLKLFYDFCKENQLSDEDINKICEPLTKTIRDGKLRKFIKIFTLILLFILFLYSLSYFETISWHYSAIGRIILIKLLPIYDWKYLKNEKCLINNEESIISSSFECTYCESMQNIRTEYDLNEEYIKDRFIDMDVPIILKDSLEESWPKFFQNDENYDIINAILKDDSIYYSYPCKLSTNLQNNNNLLLGKVLEKLMSLDSYFLHFANCDFDVMKSFRLYAPRPKFLYPEISPIQYNWLFLSKNYNVTKFKRIKLNERIMIFGQVDGINRIKLTPINECENECNVMEIMLNKGDALIFTNLWDFEYKPEPDMVNVAVLLETH